MNFHVTYVMRYLRFMKRRNPKTWELKKGGKNEFSCQICDKKFIKSPSLKTYIDTVHEKKKEEI